jgi:hypothetical protein
MLGTSVALVKPGPEYAVIPFTISTSESRLELRSTSLGQLLRALETYDTKHLCLAVFPMAFRHGHVRTCE